MGICGLCGRKGLLMACLLGHGVTISVGIYALWQGIQVSVILLDMVGLEFVCLSLQSLGMMINDRRGFTQ